MKWTAEVPTYKAAAFPFERNIARPARKICRLLLNPPPRIRYRGGCRRARQEAPGCHGARAGFLPFMPPHWSEPTSQKVERFASPEDEAGAGPSAPGEGVSPVLIPSRPLTGGSAPGTRFSPRHETRQSGSSGYRLNPNAGVRVMILSPSPRCRDWRPVRSHFEASHAPPGAGQPAALCSGSLELRRMPRWKGAAMNFQTRIPRPAACSRSSFSCFSRVAISRSSFSNWRSLSALGGAVSSAHGISATA
jgi:hypothetical protein